MKIVVGTVFYEQAKDWFVDFLDSLNKQEEISFDFLIINDNLSKETEEIVNNHISNMKSNTTMINTKNCLEPYELRVMLLNKAKEKGYDLIILGDCDDIFSSNRVKEYSKIYSKEFTFYYNDIFELYGGKKIFNLPKTTYDKKQILEKNYLGLSNTGVNLNRFSREFINSLFLGNVKVFDWYLFSRVLLDGGQGKYVPNAITYYRIHDNNLAGLCMYENGGVEKELEVKRIHYKSLKKFDLIYKELYDNCMLLNRDSIKVVGGSDGGWWNLIRIKMM